MECKLYKGYVPFYVFKKGDDGVGYYREQKWVINLVDLIPPEVPDEYSFTKEQLDDLDWLVPYAAKRARRQRTEDGKRKKKGPSRR